MSELLRLMDEVMPVGVGTVVGRQLSVGGDMRVMPQVGASAGFVGSSASYVISYTGEKNGGEAGPIIQYKVDHYALRDRSWQLLLESEPCSIIFNKYLLWIIGTGLRLQAIPQKKVLESEGVMRRAKSGKVKSGETERGAEDEADEDWTEDFSELVEARWKLWADNEMSDWTNMRNVNWLEYRAFAEAIIGGDCLVVHRLVKGVVKIELIDGGRVRTPLNMAGTGGSTLLVNGEGLDYVNPKTGFRVVHGVEINERGEHVAYWVQKKANGLGALEYTRILARGSRSGVLMAYMVYGNEYRLNNTRGIPLIAAVIETAKVMERYKTASLGAAEELAKVPYFIEHGVTSTGQDPMIKQYARTMSGFLDEAGLAAMKQNQTIDFQQNVLATMGKMIFNMPVDSKISVPDRNLEMAFKEFFDTNFNYFSATLMMPPEVALSMYNSNYSASKGARNDMDHMTVTRRKWFSAQFNQRVYNFWLDNEVLSGKIPAPGYEEAYFKGNEMALAAYRYAKWRGDSMSSIDPAKDAEYWRTLLGSTAEHIPLATVEEATEALTSGDSESNILQFAKEKKRAEDAGIKPVEQNVGKNAGNVKGNKQDNGPKKEEEGGSEE